MSELTPGVERRQDGYYAVWQGQEKGPYDFATIAALELIGMKGGE